MPVTQLLLRFPGTLAFLLRPVSRHPLGGGEVHRDRTARLFFLWRDLAQEIRRDKHRGNEIIPPFVAAVNPHVAEKRRNLEFLPLEFHSDG